MKREHVQTAVWLDETIKAIQQIKTEAEHIGECRFKLGDKISNEIYSNVAETLRKAINKINQEFEKI